MSDFIAAFCVGVGQRTTNINYFHYYLYYRNNLKITILNCLSWLVYGVLKIRLCLIKLHSFLLVIEGS